MDGFESVRRYRTYEKAQPDTTHLFILGMSANNDEVATKAALDVGMDAFITKPFTYEGLVAVLARVRDSKGPGWLEQSSHAWVEAHEQALAVEAEELRVQLQKEGKAGGGSASALGDSVNGHTLGLKNKPTNLHLSLSKQNSGKLPTGVSGHDSLASSRAVSPREDGSGVKKSLGSSFRPFAQAFDRMAHGAPVSAGLSQSGRTDATVHPTNNSGKALSSR